MAPACRRSDCVGDIMWQSFGSTLPSVRARVSWAPHSPTFCLLPVEVMNNDHWFLPSSRSVGPSLSFIACHTYIEAMLRYGLHSSAFSCTVLVDAISIRP